MTGLAPEAATVDSVAILVDGEYNMLHLPASAGRFLVNGAGGPGRNLLHAVRPGLRAGLLGALRKAAQTGAECDVLVGPLELDGRGRGVEVRVSPVRAQGSQLFLVTLSAPAGAVPQGNEALLAQVEELARALAESEAARTKLHAADAAKDGFLAVLSHELRNPLASIDSAAGLLQAQELPVADRDAAARVVQRQAQAMKKLLDDLLDVSRLKLGRMALQREDVTLGHIVESALETTRPLLEAARHTLKVDMPSHPITIHGNLVRLGQVVSNLLANAIKYTPAGGEIVLEGRIEGRQATLTVSDNGVGMDPATIENMFDMFTQAQRATDRSQGGLGIGLALVRSIVELHGGKVEASSAGFGKGSQFRVTLPAERGVAPAATPAPARVDAAPRPASRHRGLILIADDNVDAGWGISRLLEIAGFGTVLVHGGLDAVTQVRRHKPDVAILDIGMPDLDGHQAARQIRETEWGRQMVLIAATGWGPEADEREALASGFDAYMTKPLDLRKLGAVVDDLLARKRS